MYQCRDCGRRFEAATTVIRENGVRIEVCPECGGDFFGEIQSTHCRCCGAKLPKNASEYCNDHCRKRGRIMWERERKLRNLGKIDPLQVTLRAVQKYNKLHHTRYSYGQFVTLVLPKLSKEELQNDLY